MITFLIISSAFLAGFLAFPIMTAIVGIIMGETEGDRIIQKREMRRIEKMSRTK